MRFTPKALCRGYSAISVTMVVQLGLEMMPLCFLTSAALISGTTNGTFFSIRKALELSTTTQPFAAATGPKALLMELPALKRAMSTLSKESFVSSRIVIDLPLNRVRLPVDRLEASGSNRLTGNFLCSSTRSIS